jgi:hypothetical protein
MANHAEKRFVLTNDLLSAATRWLGFQSFEDATPVAVTTHILVNPGESYLGLVGGVKMQASAGQWLTRRIKKEEMKRESSNESRSLSRA